MANAWVNNNMVSPVHRVLLCVGRIDYYTTGLALGHQTASSCLPVPVLSRGPVFCTGSGPAKTPSDYRAAVAGSVEDPGVLPGLPWPACPCVLQGRPACTLPQAQGGRERGGWGRPRAAPPG